MAKEESRGEREGSETRPAEIVSVESLFGGQIASEKSVLAGMRGLEADLKAGFYSELDQRDVATAPADMVRDALLEVIGRDQMAGVVERLRGAADPFRSLELESPEAILHPQRIFLGSIGATVVPPFSYQWSWSAGMGTPSLSVSANRITGKMSFGAWDNFHNSSNGSVAAALGIYFRPMVTNGILRLSANPAFTYGWGTWSVMCSSHSDGWLGLYVGRYNLSGGFDGAPINQRTNLWNDNSWWSGAGWHTGSNTGYPLFAQTNVDSSHWYALWIWCGGGISACGWDSSPFWGSGAGSTMSITLPSISWELF